MRRKAIFISSCDDQSSLAKPLLLSKNYAMFLIYYG